MPTDAAHYFTAARRRPANGFGLPLALKPRQLRRAAPAFFSLDTSRIPRCLASSPRLPSKVHARLLGGLWLAQKRTHD